MAAAPAESANFVNQINQLRASKGLGALAVDSNLSSVAQGWAQHMGEAGAISHRSSLASGITIDWRLLGENVGHAPDVDQMMTAFINSPAHYKNLVEGSFNYIGVGTVRTADGMLFSAHEFAYVRPAAAPAPAPTPAPAPAVKAAPAKVAVQNAAPAVTTPAPAVTSTTAAPVTTVVTVAPAHHHSVVESASADAPHAAAKTHTGC
jgi:hypothetical protein